MAHCRYRWPLLFPVISGCFLLLATADSSISAPRTPSFAAASHRLEHQLAQKVTVHWQNVPLQQAATRLGESQRLCIWLDRRVDSTRNVSLNASSEPLADILNHLSSQAEAASVATGDVYYVGPAKIVRDLRTLRTVARNQASLLPRKARSLMLKPVPLHITRLSEPRQLVEQLAKHAGLKVIESRLVPHDLMPACQLPSMATAEQLAIILAGFDLRWQAEDSGRAVRVVPIEQPVEFKQRYSRELIAKAPSGLIPAGAVTRADDRNLAWVSASAEVHELLTSCKPNAPGLSVPSRRPQQRGRQVYSLRVDQQPVGKILEQLARQLGKQLDVAKPLARSASLDKRVSFEVHEANLAELLDAACKPAGLVAEVEGDAIRVTGRGDR